MTNAINCANTVAAAAPHVPVFHTATNKRSSTIFNPTEIARINNGVNVSPMARITAIKIS